MKYNDQPPFQSGPTIADVAKNIFKVHPEGTIFLLNNDSLNGTSLIQNLSTAQNTPLCIRIELTVWIKMDDNDVMRHRGKPLLTLREIQTIEVDDDCIITFGNCQVSCDDFLYNYNIAENTPLCGRTELSVWIKMV